MRIRATASYRPVTIPNRPGLRSHAFFVQSLKLNLHAKRLLRARCEYEASSIRRRPMKPLHPNLIATRTSLTVVGDSGVRGNRFGEASRWSRSSGRPLVTKAALKRRAEYLDAVVSQPWQRCENSAPDITRSQNPSQRIKEVALDSQAPDRCLTGEHTAEGWATRLDISQAAVASGDAQLFPQVRIHESERGRASRMARAGTPNLLP
jgi:hypothetical protein